MEVRVFPTRKGQMSATLTYYDLVTQQSKYINLCSKFDPLQEAKRWANGVYEEQVEIYVIYGLGLGYHISELSELINHNQKIIVLECNVLLHSQIRPYINQSIYGNPQVQIHITEDIVEVGKLFKSVNQSKMKFIIHDTLLKTLPEELDKLRQALEHYQFKQNTVLVGRHTHLVKENYQYYRAKDYPNISQCYGIQRGRPLVIVSGGPSLNNNVDVLHQASEDVFIFAVGRVLKMLLHQEVKPRMFGIIDPHHELMMQQVEGIEEQDIPLVFLNTASYQAVEKYKGPKYIAYSMDSDETQEGRIETGGSVATALLDLAIKFKANPIIFIGQDLAYTNNYSHAEGTDNIWEVKESKVMARVKGVSGEYLPTTPAMLGFKYFIEDKIRQNSHITFYNCTEGGAYIEGCKHQTLYETLVEINALKSK